MNEQGWIKRAVGTRGLPAGLGMNQMVEFRVGDDPMVHADEAGQLAWGDGPGAISEYRPLVPAGVGDVNGTALGTAARFNASKPDLSLIPAGILAAWAEYDGCKKDYLSPTIYWPLVLSSIGAFQMRDDGRGMLLHALHVMDNDGLLWADCARVFDYGRQKYSAWNWARGQAWSIPIASALRHIVFGTLQGETIDPESGLPHRGHIACNIVMLLWFIDHYPEGDDRFTPPALPHA